MSINKDFRILLLVDNNSFAASQLQAVTLTTSSAAIDENFIKMMTYPFHKASAFCLQT